MAIVLIHDWNEGGHTCDKVEQLLIWNLALCDLIRLKSEISMIVGGPSNSRKTRICTCARNYLCIECFRSTLRWGSRQQSSICLLTLSDPADICLPFIQHVNAGAPQGFVLGPSLPVVYEWLTRRHCLQGCNDTSSFNSIDKTRCTETFNSDIKAVTRWLVYPRISSPLNGLVVSIVLVSVFLPRLFSMCMYNSV